MNTEVISNKLISSKFGLMTVRYAPIAKDKNVGRFFMVSTHSNSLSLDPLLNRPFAPCEIIDDETFSFLYMIVGRGTKLLAEKRAGDKLLINGPIGNYFKLTKGKKVALVAGGVGVAPMVMLGRRLRENGNHVTLIYGGRSASDIIIQDIIEKSCDELIPATDDGSLGVHGNVGLPLKDRLTSFDKVYACGPNRMLKAVSELCISFQVPIEVSLDEQMACGAGACLGCLVGIIENGATVQKRCCVEGPVFDGSKVDWSFIIR